MVNFLGLSTTFKVQSSRGERKTKQRHTAGCSSAWTTISLGVGSQPYSRYGNIQNCLCFFFLLFLSLSLFVTPPPLSTFFIPLADGGFSSPVHSLICLCLCLWVCLQLTARRWTEPTRMKHRIQVHHLIGAARTVQCWRPMLEIDKSS